MYRGAFALTAALLIAVSAPLRAGAQGIEGNWKVSFVTNGTLEQTAAIVKLKIDDGKITGELVSARLGVTLKSVTQEGNTMRIVLQSGNSDLVFEGAVPQKAGAHLLGAVSFNGAFYPGGLSGTGDDKFDPKAATRNLPCQPFQDARALTNKVVALRFQAQQTKDPEKKAALLKQVADADQTARKETAKLYREVLAQHSDSPAVFEAAIALMQSAKTNDAKVEDVKSWAATASDKAKAYGPRWQAEFAAQMAKALVGQEGFANLAVEYARQAEKSLTPKTAAADQVRILSLLSRALRQAGNADEAKTLDVRVAKLDDILDKEYSTTMPGFKGEAFTGRKSKSERAVFMELFTGATCPPCVAADLAFDVLQKTYKANELVLIQYHMHIPGPDPLTNPDTEARWKYYGAEVRGVPASLFNGKAKASGGGGVVNAEKKYEAYRGVIDTLLEEDANVKLTVSAKRNGDKIDIHAKVSGLNEPGTDKKLRILLAEETVRYAGSNGVRLHHNVVRAFPGGVEGLSLTEAATKQNVSISIGELRGRLDKYLTEFEAKGRTFANPARPMALEHLRVIAFVQDDVTHDILQAVQVQVEDK